MIKMKGQDLCKKKQTTVENILSDKTNLYCHKAKNEINKLPEKGKKYSELEIHNAKRQDSERRGYGSSYYINYSRGKQTSIKNRRYIAHALRRRSRRDVYFDSDRVKLLFAEMDRIKEKEIQERKQLLMDPD